MAKILIAEDEKMSRQTITNSIEGMGHSAIQCRDGKQALDILAENPDIALLVTDVSMPEMDGQDLVKAIRSQQETAGLPVIVISGVVGPKEIADVLSMGATAFIPKPVKPADIREYINRYIG